MCLDQLDVPTMIRMLSDAVSMLGHVNYDLSLKRRQFIRRALAKKYQDLCNDDHVVTKWLFGEDIHKDMKDVKESQELGYQLKKDDHSSNYNPKYISKKYEKKDFWKRRNNKFKMKHKKVSRDKKSRRRVQEMSEED